MSDDICNASESSEQHVPNYVVSTQEASGVRCRKLKFYPEDVEKMKTMTTLEQAYYKLKLQGEGRYYH